MLAFPMLLFFGAFFVAPLLLLVAVSFFDDPDITVPGLSQYTGFLSDAFNWRVLGQTLLLGVKVVACTTLLAYPIALLFLAAGPRLRRVLLMLILVPLLTSVVVRTFAWIVLLSREGVVNSLLLSLGIVGAPVQLLHTELGLIIALMQIELPLMLLPLVSVMARLDPNVVAASQALGAGSWRTLVRVILPLSLPGYAAGVLLVFASSTAAFVSQSVIGGGRLIYMPLFVYQQATTLYNWPFAAAISVILVLAISLVAFGINHLGRSARGNIHG
ncbi:ABC transporter permease [Roseomonas rosulenta]|uniref:ABC transporter permease n=1 Tax=Roseomonas rosulenta TaxID=2748667 RepID=UPI0018DF3A60|nr:ABC transporter permease [Roseomonas rosulenta]